MGIVNDSVQSHAVPENVLETFSSQQSRGEIAEHFADLLKVIVDLTTRVTVLEHAGATPATVSLAVQVNALQRELDVAREIAKNRPTVENRAYVAMVERELEGVKASVDQAKATPAEPSPVAATLKGLLSGASDSPAQQLVNA